MFGSGTRRTRGRSLRTRLGAVAVTAAVAGALAVSSVPAGAAEGTVTGATIEWSFNNEVALKAPPFGGCNYLSAGASDGTQAQYSTQSGNTTILVNGAQPTFATKCAYVSAQTPQKFVIGGGTGTLDPATGAATIGFDGTVSANFYGGIAPFSITDLVLTVDGSGNGQLVGTVLTYSGSQDDPFAPKVALPPVENVVIATISGASSANTTGFTVTPNYSGVLYQASGDAAPQNRVNPGWGAWPTSWIDVHVGSGLSSYWYSSGGAADGVKAPNALTIGYGTYDGPGGGDPDPDPEPEPTTPSVSATPNAGLDPAVDNTLTVTGSGFNTIPAGSQGLYVGFVSAAKWQPGQVPVASDFIAKFIPTAQIVNGAFTTTIEVPANTATSGNWGVGTYCAHACATTNRTLDSWTSVLFSSAPVEPGAGDLSITATIPEQEPAGEFSWTIDSEDRAVVLTEAENKGSYLQSTGSLKPVKVTDTRAGAPAWSVSGQVGDFSGGLSGKYLGWTPAVTAAGAGAVAGAKVDPGIDSGNGLKTSSVLASATSGHAKGTATLGAALDLRVPVETPAGTYTATLTLTALS